MTIRYAAVLVACSALGCARAEQPANQGAGADASAASAAPAPAPAPDAAADGLVPGTPAGGLERWIAEVRAGVDTLPALAERDAAAAKNQALLLYVTRQEYLEIYYGAAGRAVKDSVLAEAVTTAETRFHELLRTVNTAAGGIDSVALRKAAAALDAQYDRVLDRAHELGVNGAALAPSEGGAR